MTLVELIDSHGGFKIITDRITTKSPSKNALGDRLCCFFLSAVLDNLTTTILMVSLLLKLVPHKAERFLLCCVVVIAANAGGAWTPIRRRHDSHALDQWPIDNGWGDEIALFAVLISLLFHKQYFGQPEKISAHPPAKLEAKCQAQNSSLSGSRGLIFCSYL